MERRVDRLSWCHFDTTKRSFSIFRLIRTNYFIILIAKAENKAAAATSEKEKAAKKEVKKVTSKAKAKEEDASSSDYIDESPAGRMANLQKAIKHNKLDAGVVK